MAISQRDVTSTATSLSIIDNVNPQQVSATMQKIHQFQAVVQKTLKRDHDYGIIPGTGNKPTLLKPGAEKILMLLGLTSEYDVIEKVQDYENGFFAFTVKCTLYKNDLKITEGVGHANTKEARYSRRWVTEKKLPDGVNKDSLPKREKEGKYGKYVEYQIDNDDPYTLANTVLKMAKKRAQVDATLTVASLSDIFTQDLEDYEEANMPALSTNGSFCTEAQLKKIYAEAKKKGADVHALIKERYGVESAKELTKQQASELIGMFQKMETQDEPKQEKQEKEKINWTAFWTKVKELGLDQTAVHTYASELFGKEVKSLTEVIDSQQTLDEFLVVLQEKVIETAAGA